MGQGVGVGWGIRAWGAGVEDPCHQFNHHFDISTVNYFDSD